MSVINPEKVVTKQDLADFYQGILPYLGGSADAGFTPVGTVIPMIAEVAPANYLICDGTAYNKTDYPELANHLLSMTNHSQYEVSGDSTKFKVPDLRGEFIRMTGTNSHANQGSGADVGVHQDGTQIPNTYGVGGVQIRVNLPSNNSNNLPTLADAHKVLDNGQIYSYVATSQQSDSAKVDYAYTARPTNTSVLFCIATKNIFLNPSLDYSTDEKIVGTWIDGKPLYQKTVSFGALPNANGKSVAIGSDLSIDKVISINGQAFNSVDGESIPIPYAHPHDLTYAIMCRVQDLNTASPCVYVYTKINYSTYNAYITIQYTKTT